MYKSWISSAALAALLFLPTNALAADYVVTLKDHQFSPKELTLPADQRVQITVKNLDSTPAEFESYKLNREKVVASNSTIILFLGPLSAGRYTYFDDFH